MYEFKLPDLGEGIHEGEILKWHVASGDDITEDAPLVEVETDKAAVSIPSPRAGRIAMLGAEVGEIVSVGDVIVRIDDGQAQEEPSGEARGEPNKAITSPAAKAEAAEQNSGANLPRSNRPVPAAPATRRLAREMGIDLHQVRATGPAGRVSADDLKNFAKTGAKDPVTTENAPAIGVQDQKQDQAAIAAQAARAANTIPFLDLEPLPDFSQWGPVEHEPLRSIRRKVAHKMVTSMILVPHVAHMDEADVTELEAFRQRERQRRKDDGSRLTLLPFIVKAVTAGLRAAPNFNASLDPFKQELIYKQYFNIGIAADTGRGLVVPVVKETERKSIMQISAEIQDLAQRARDQKLQSDELRGGTFTVTNVGPLGGTALIPAINYPDVAILGMGRVQEKPVVRNGEIVIRKVLPLTLAFDHRVADGADAARFVSELVRQLSDPHLPLLET